jgi:hypothetical protein
MAALYAGLLSMLPIRKRVVPFYEHYRDMQRKSEKKSSKGPTGAASWSLIRACGLVR